MRRFGSAVMLVLVVAPAMVRADVTIRYTTETTSPLPQMPVRASSEVIYMKGNKGATIANGETTIVDFARQEVTIIDNVRRKYATIPAAEYGDKMNAQMTAMMPAGSDAPAVADMLKAMKTTCDTKTTDAAEMIQGVRAVEREVTCTMTMDMPDNMKAVMPSMGTKIVSRFWTAAPSERLRVPGLWQLSGFELWQTTFMNPTGAVGKMMPDAMKPMMDAMRQKDQSATLRFSMEVSMQMPVPGMPAGDKPMMTMKREMTELSTALLDDSLFSVPSDFSAEPFEAVMGGVTDAAMASVKTDVAEAEKAEKVAAASRPGAAAPKPAIAENVKAYVPKLVPLSDSEPEAPAGADGKKVYGFVDLLVTVGPRGNVERAEAVGGPEALRKTATDAVQKWTYRPVIREGAAVTAYTDADVVFADETAADGGFEFTQEMADAAIYLSDLEGKFPRTPAQKLADLEQDSGGGSKARRYDRVDEMAAMAVKAGANDTAKAYATELLAGVPDHGEEGHRTTGDGIHDGHLVLGLVALRNDDVPTARAELLEAGKTPGSPWLSGYGPNMLLADELLKKGERAVVLDYFELCQKFWTLGGERLNAWSEAVRKGEMPAFGGNLRWGETDERR